MSGIQEIIEGLLKRGKVTDDELQSITVRIHKDTNNRIEKLSKVLGESKSSLIRMLLDNASIEAENHLNQIQGIPKGRKAGGRSAKGKNKAVQGRTTTRRKVQDSEGHQAIDRGHDMSNVEI